MMRFQQLLSIKQGESRMAFLVIGVMLFTSMGAALGGTGIEALFFARFGVEYLPYMFVGLGITSMIMSFGVTHFLAVFHVKFCILPFRSWFRSFSSWHALHCS